MRSSAALSPILLAAVVLLGGCVLVPVRPASRAQTATCHPSQYWDGSQCRHKGQGHGARKHDGRGKPGKKR